MIFSLREALQQWDVLDAVMLRDTFSPSTKTEAIFLLTWREAYHCSMVTLRNRR